MDKVRKIPKPRFLRQNYETNLVRLGRDNDGGYLVSPVDIEKSDLLISLGVNDDWSFEQAFVNNNPVPVSAYDGSVSRRYFYRNIIKSLKQFRLRSFCRAVNIYKSYNKFFKEKFKAFCIVC